MRIRNLIGITILGVALCCCTADMRVMKTRSARAERSLINHCEKLENKNKPQHRLISVYGQFIKKLTIAHGGRPPNRAAAAMLVAGLRHCLGFQRLELVIDKRTLCEFSNDKPSLHGQEATFDHFYVHIGAEWPSPDDKDTCVLKECCDECFCSNTGTRFQFIGLPPAPATMKLHAHLSNNAWNNDCKLHAQTLQFYADQSKLSTCDFKFESDITTGGKIIPTTKCSNPTDLCLPVLVPPESYLDVSNKTAIKLAEIVNTTGLSWRILVGESDSSLRSLLKSTYNNISVLFVDYELWTKNDTNQVILVPSPLPELTTVQAAYVGDTKFLQQYAPQLYNAMTDFSIGADDINEILNLEDQTLSIEEAACAHANNKQSILKWANQIEPPLMIYIMFCGKTNKTKKSFYSIMEDYLNNHLTRKINLYYNDFDDCRNEHTLIEGVSQLTTMLIAKQNIVGIVAAGVGISAAESASIQEFIMVNYDVPEKINLNPLVFTAYGTLQPLSIATNKYIKDNGWRRIAILSDGSALARNFTAHLKTDREIIFTVRDCNNCNDKKEITSILKELIDINARVFFLNMDRANDTLCAALDLGLTADAGYAWIVKNWQQQLKFSCNLNEGSLRYTTLSYSWRGGDKSTLPNDINGSSILFNKWNNTTLCDEFNELWDNSWPPYGASLIDSVILLSSIMTYGLDANISYRFDIHGSGVAKYFTNNIRSNNSLVINGLYQRLWMDNFSHDNPLVFVDTWLGNGTREPIAVWRVSSDAIEVLKTFQSPSDKLYGPALTDGTKSCFHASGDPFAPTCHDAAWIILIVLLLLSPLLIWFARRTRLAHLAARDQALQIRLLARCERTAGALVGHLVDRTTLDLKEELGTGHFGRVRLGLLKSNHKPIKAVAVKTLREDAVPAEEAEFLREACALAALSHKHIVGLVGVCAVDGPPLLLMERAFFGDLLNYLRERKTLAQVNEADDSKITDTEVMELTTYKH